MFEIVYFRKDKFNHNFKKSHNRLFMVLSNNLILQNNIHFSLIYLILKKSLNNFMHIIFHCNLNKFLFLISFPS